MSFSTGNVVAIGIITGIFGFIAGVDISEKNNPINITGEVSSGLFKPHKLRIFFNGDQVLAGNLDNNGSGNFVGSHDGKPVSAICSTNNNTSCILDFNDEKRTITFNKKAEE